MGRFATRAPGIDPRRADLPELKVSRHLRLANRRLRIRAYADMLTRLILQANIVIQAVDYNARRAEFNVLTNEELPAFLDKGRPEFSKVRWLHVNGLS